MVIIRKLLVGTVIAGGVLFGASQAGTGTTAEVNKEPQNQPKQDLETPSEGKPSEEPKKAENGANKGQIKDDNKEPIPTKTEQKQESTVKVATIKEEPKPTPQPNYKTMTVEATAYVSFCDTGCIGITKTGTDVRNTIYHPSGLPIIAVDPNVIPLGSIVEINGQKYIADDTGGAIKGNRIDILVSTTDTSKAYEFGRQMMDIKVYK